MISASKQILEKLNYIKAKLNKMEKKIIDSDIILTEDDILSLN